MKNCNKLFLLIVVMGIALAVAPLFAQQPTTISGVWLRENPSASGIFGGRTSDNRDEKIYYYFSPGGTNGTAVGVATKGDILGGQQILPFTGTWRFVEKDGQMYFYVERVRAYMRGNFVGGNAFVPGAGTYRFYTEGGTQKMEFQQRINDEFAEKEIWIKVGTKLTDLPEIGDLALEDYTGGRFWALNGIVVK